MYPPEITNPFRADFAATSGRPSPIRCPTSVETAMLMPSTGMNASVLRLNAMLVAASSFLPNRPMSMMNAVNPAMSMNRL